MRSELFAPSEVEVLSNRVRLCLQFCVKGAAPKTDSFEAFLEPQKTSKVQPDLRHDLTFSTRAVGKFDIFSFLGIGMELCQNQRVESCEHDRVTY